MKIQLIKYQATCNETEIINEKLKQTEREVADIRKEANNYQNMLQQSQTQYATLERKYSKVKKMLRDFQQRDRDMVKKNNAGNCCIRIDCHSILLDPISRVLSSTSTRKGYGI